MFPSPLAISNSSEEASINSFETRVAHQDFINGGLPVSPQTQPRPPLSSSQKKKKKKKRSQPGNPDPEAEVVALSPGSLQATNRFVCEICGKGFQRDQNLQLHRRGHNLPWRLRQRGAGKEAAAARKKVYVCPEPTCVHHHPSRALGDLTGIKKHFSRKHGEKKWKCDKCSKKYAVLSDWKAHVKTCGTREYRCDCGTLFSRKDSFVTHRAFCDALAEESARLMASSSTSTFDPSSSSNPNLSLQYPNLRIPHFHVKLPQDPFQPFFNPYLPRQQPHSSAASATALLQQASSMGHFPAAVDQSAGAFFGGLTEYQCCDRSTTRDFLGAVAGEELLPLPGLGGLDPVTGPPRNNDDRSGDQTRNHVGFEFPPVSGAWGP
ncbi:Zinc finger protein MAGPIE [Apostasia shenzhenica]|uniref:Protein EARLY HEADING DATE 2 n=1 Tax=Apostasia shenzhenica TaxID=1088818 RepID=A0A2H9ZZS3_9ASPA|nr:Zinc finger protein MAGPIE [Apostasia shenzhenica]